MCFCLLLVTVRLCFEGFVWVFMLVVCSGSVFNASVRACISFVCV